MKLGFCVACGKTADLHHIRFTPRGGDDDSNLITLCRSCSYKRWQTKADLIAQAKERAEHCGRSSPNWWAFRHMPSPPN